MDNERISFLNKPHIVSLPRLAICLFTAMAFLLHFFTYELSATAYCVTLIVLVIVFAITKTTVRYGLSLTYISSWLLALGVIVYNYLLRYNTNTVLIDLSVFLSGFVIIICFSQKADDYTATLFVIKNLAVFFALGVLIQRLILPLYEVIIQVFPSHIRSALRTGIYATSKIKGFSTNPGFSAGYIIAGIFAVYALIQRDKLTWKRNLIIILFLMIALLMTGKRGPFLFMILSIATVRILPERGSKRFKKLWFGLMVILAIIVQFFLLQDVLVQIPLLRRLVISVQGFLSGDDISTGRDRLSAWALQLFRRDPVIGIGWGRYRTTTIGNATLTKSLDTHNVYLQLLCETGVIGFAAFTLVFIFSWNMTRKGYCSCFRTDDPNLAKWMPALFFSFIYQTFFLLYCITGNPLYDQFYQILYTLSCSIAVAYNFAFRKQLKKNSLLCSAMGGA